MTIIMMSRGMDRPAEVQDGCHCSIELKISCLSRALLVRSFVVSQL